MITDSRSGISRCFSALIFSVLIWPMAGCNKPVQYSGADSGNAVQASDKAQLFTVSQDQLAHIQIVTVAPPPIPRSLRLTGAVAYDAFNTTPVITQIGGPVSRIVVMPGQQVHRGEPLLYVASPDYSLLLASYLKM